MQQQQSDKDNNAGSEATGSTPKLATNPNPRANENLEGTHFDKNTPKDEVPDAGSEITDGEGG